jgi:DNA polymerase-3 subunit delta
MADRGPIPDTLEADLRAGRLAQVYLFHGGESLLMEEAIQRVIEAAVPEGARAFNLDFLSGGDADIRDILAHASAFPMMADRRVVLVRDVDRLGEKALELLAHYLDRPSPTTVLLLAGTKPDLRRKAFAAVRKKGMAFAFDELRDYQLPDWIVHRVGKRGGTIDAETAKLLAAYVGSSLRDIDNELDKLFLYIGERTVITQNDVAAVVGFSREYSVFELQNAIGRRDARRSVEILERMLEANEPVPLILSSLTNYFAKLWLIGDQIRRGTKHAEVAALAKIPPYYLKDYLQTLERYTPEEIEGSFHQLALADQQFKTSGADIKTILHRFCISMVLPRSMTAGAGT